MVIYLKFVLMLGIASFLFPMIYSLLALPLFGLAVGGLKLRGEHGEERPWIARAIGSLLFALLSIATIYILCGWSAYVAFRSLTTTLNPKVIHDWLYFITGFILCHGPLSYMASKEQDRQNSGCFAILLAMVAYVVFCLWPGLAMLPYGWFLSRLFNLQME